MLRRSGCVARNIETQRTSAFQVNKNCCVPSGQRGMFSVEIISVSHLAVSLRQELRAAWCSVTGC